MSWFRRRVSALVRLRLLRLNGIWEGTGPSASPRRSDPGPQPAESAQPIGCFDLADLLAGVPWTLVGAQTVMLQAFEAGEVLGRTTGDVGLLFEVRAYTGATGEMTRRLLTTGFTETRPSPDGVAHRFIKGVVVVDVLGRIASVGVRRGQRSRAVAPSKSRAAARRWSAGDRGCATRRSGCQAAPAVSTRGDAPQGAGGSVRRPRRPRIGGDLDFLLGRVGDPRSLAAELRKTERNWLRSREELTDRTHPTSRMSRRPTASTNPRSPPTAGTGGSSRTRSPGTSGSACGAQAPGHDS